MRFRIQVEQTFLRISNKDYLKILRRKCIKNSIAQPEEDEDLFGDMKTEHSKRTIRNSKSQLNDSNFHVKWQNQNKLVLVTMYKHELNLVLSRHITSIFSLIFQSSLKKKHAMLRSINFYFYKNGGHIGGI